MAINGNGTLSYDQNSLCTVRRFKWAISYFGYINAIKEIGKYVNEL